MRINTLKCLYMNKNMRRFYASDGNEYMLLPIGLWNIHTKFRYKMFPRPRGYLASCQMTADGEITSTRKKRLMDPLAYQPLAHYNFLPSSAKLISVQMLRNFHVHVWWTYSMIFFSITLIDHKTKPLILFHTVLQSHKF
jgi:hypothetical protein